MNLPSNSVVVAHPGKQHSYQVALAFQRAGLLRQFITGFYFRPDEFPYTLVRHLPSTLRQQALAQLHKRRLRELDDHLITSVPYFEATSRILGRFPPLLRITEGRSAYRFANLAMDWYVHHWIARCVPPPAFLYCFLGSASNAFRSARSQGGLTILDVPIVLDATRIVATERRKLGLSSRYAGLERRLYGEVLAADFVVTPSPHVAESVVKLGVPRTRVFVVPFGVDVEYYSAAPRRAVANSRFRALFAGKFDLRKGVHYLLEAWHELALTNSELVVVGPPSDRAFVQAMRTRYAGVFIERGNLSQTELVDLLAEADVFVFPSLAEGSALVTYEALASGLPCIVTHEAGSIVRDGIEGFVVPSHDVDTLKDRIRRLYDHPALRQQMGTAARQRAETFTWQHYQERLVGALTDMIAELPLGLEPESVSTSRSQRHPAGDRYVG